MGDLEQSLEELEVVKQNFKSNFNSNDVATTNVEFRNYPNLMVQLEKKLPSQTKTITPSKESQSVKADDGYKLGIVNVDSIPSQYIEPNGTLLIEENGTFDVTNYANAEVDINIVTPSGVKTITENGTHDVKDYAFAEVKVEPELRERDIIGTWSAESGFSLVLNKNGIGSYANIPIIYSITNNQIVVYIEGVEEPLYLVYNEDADTISVYGDDTIVLTRVQETANLITKEITENGTYKASDDGADGYSEVVVNVASSGGGSGGDSFDRTFANNTPEQISKASALISYNNMTSAQVAETFGWNIGDTTNITLTTGEAIQMRIIGFNHDTRTGGGKAGITLEMVNCLNTKYKMDDNYTNIWTNSKMAKTYFPQFKSTLPTEWTNVMKSVDKIINSWSSEQSKWVAANTSLSLFLLTYSELTGRVANSINFADGERYEYYANGGTPVKTIKGRSDIWWLRTMASGQSWYSVNKDGSTLTYGYAGELGVSFAFCV